MTISANDAHPFCIYAGRFRVTFPVLDADGDLVTAMSTPDSEKSLDQGTYADCSNEATEIATSSGTYYLDLIASETTGKNVSVIVKSATAGMKTTFLSIPIVRMPILRSGTAQAGAASTITLDSGASAKNGAYAGCWIQCSNNSPANVQGQTRKIISYVGSTKVATVEAAWGTNPSSATTFDILVPETANLQAFMGAELADWAIAGHPKVDVGGWLGTAPTTPGTAGVPNVDVVRIATAVVSTTTAQLGVNVVQISTDATAADNAESFFDGTGYAGTGNVIPTVTTVTGGATAAALATVQSDTDDIQTRLPAALTAGGNMKSDALALGGMTQTGRDIGASVLLSSGTGTGQLDFTSGVVKANLAQILGTALTETAGQLAGAFKKWFNVAAPTGTVNSIPDAVAGAAGGLFIAGTNAATTVTTALTTTFTGNLTGSVASVTGAVGSVTGAVGSVTAGVTLAASAVQAIWDALTSALTTVGSIGKLLVDNITGNAFTRLGTPAGASVSADIAAVKTDTAAIKLKTDNLPASPAATGDAMTLTAAYDFAKGTVAMTEAYAADGAAPTPAQALMAIQQFQQEKAVSGTTLTVKKVDGATTAATFTLDSATAPTSITRAA